MIETVSKTDPKAGNDIYLTIDKDLQINAYKLLEEKIAGIVLSKLTNILDYDPSETKDASEIIIPVSDAYHAFIANEVIDMDHFANEEAGPAEKAVYATFQSKKESTLAILCPSLRTIRQMLIKICQMKCRHICHISAILYWQKRQEFF